MTLVTRNPYARSELHKERIFDPRCTCAWCGQIRRTRHRMPVPYLYQFRSETDGGRVYHDPRLFCSRSCMESYHS